MTIRRLSRTHTLYACKTPEDMVALLKWITRKWSAA